MATTCFTFLRWRGRRRCAMGDKQNRMSYWSRFATQVGASLDSLDYLCNLRTVEDVVQGNLDAIRELIQEELAAQCRAGTLVMGGREVELSPNSADEREAEIACI